MRRLAIVALALLVIPAGVQAEPDAYAGMQFTASAIWTVHSRDRATTYVVFAGRQVDKDGILTYAAIARKSCLLQGSNTTCPTKAIVRAIDQDDLDIDPLLSRATLKVQRSLWVQSVTWTGVGESRPGYRYIYAGPPNWVTPIWAGAFISNSRPAVASGRLFGMRIRESDAEEVSLGFNSSLSVDSDP